MTALTEMAGRPAAAAKRLEKLLKAVPMLQSAVQSLLTGKVDDWHSEYAYSAGLQAFITEPVILSHPDVGERYFTFELIGIDSDNFAYVGQRTTGAKAGSFAIVGPDWDGDLPDDVDQSLAHAQTTSRRGG